MSPQLHAVVGSLVILVNLVVGIWAIVRYRRTDKPGGALSASSLAGFALLVIQVLIGLYFASTGALPYPRSVLLSVIHMGGPILALLGSIYHIFISRRNKVRNYRTAALMTVVLGLISYAIGEMGARLT